MSADVLTIEVPTFYGDNREYPSSNRMTDRFRGGKPPGYHPLRNAVCEAARAEIMRVSWERATYYCDVYWKRYMPNRRAANTDAQNAGTAEMNGLQDAGVFENDRLVRWHADVPQYDPGPGAIDRIAIVVMRTFAPAILAEVKPRKKAPRSKRIAPETPDIHAAFAEAQAEARRRAPRSVDDYKNGETVRVVDIPGILQRGGITPRRPR
jgi:hypothetical protein